MKKASRLLLLAAIIPMILTGCTESPAAEGSGAVSSKPAVVQSSEVQSSEESSEISEDEVSETEYTVSCIDDLESKYFVSRLPERLQKCFAYLYGSAKDMKDEIVFPEEITEDELSTLMYLLNYDCPELIHVSGDYRPRYSLSAVSTDPIEGVGIYFTMDKQQLQEANGLLEDYLTELRSRTEDMTEDEIEKTVYDTIFYGCTYNEGHEYAGSIFGALISGQARCEGLCKAYMWCMRKLGMECMCVSGPQGWNDGATYSDHSWNIVRVNGEYYHLDLTLDNIRTDDETKTEPNYGFFNVNDDFILKSHNINPVFTEIGVPECTFTEYNYHIRNDLYIQKGENLHERLNRILGSRFTEDGIPPVSIKCEAEEDYITLGSEATAWVKDLLSEYSSADFKVSTYTTELSETILIQADKK